MKRIWGIVLMFITVLAVLGCGTDSITGGSGKVFLQNRVWRLRLFPN